MTNLSKEAQTAVDIINECVASIEKGESIERDLELIFKSLQNVDYRDFTAKRVEYYVESIRTGALRKVDNSKSQSGHVTHNKVEDLDYYLNQLIKENKIIIDTVFSDLLMSAFDCNLTYSCVTRRYDELIDGI